ncbi:hypothetical protein [Nostoc sp.]|uniref:hypothetical protein n=1 Tax=Nostoc sp. TaxID=1180 RepID=UPI002FF72CE6
MLNLSFSVRLSGSDLASLKEKPLERECVSEREEKALRYAIGDALQHLPAVLSQHW